MTQADAPLAGLRVLELATGVAGPYAGRLLAMLGATVVKVEPPGGDPARTKQVDDEPLTGIVPAVPAPQRRQAQRLGRDDRRRRSGTR